MFLYAGKELPDTHVMVNLLKDEVSDIEQGGLRGSIIGKGKLLSEINSKGKIRSTVFVILIEKGDLFPGISERIAGKRGVRNVYRYVSHFW